MCGDSHRGEVRLCGQHFLQAKKAYPQGWAYYPGDTCEHGKYVGGIGADLMCFRCEIGDEL